MISYLGMSLLNGAACVVEIFFMFTVGIYYVFSLTASCTLLAYLLLRFDCLVSYHITVCRFMCSYEI